MFFELWYINYAHNKKETSKEKKRKRKICIQSSYLQVGEYLSAGGESTLCRETATATALAFEFYKMAPLRKRLYNLSLYFLYVKQLGRHC